MRLLKLPFLLFPLLAAGFLAGCETNIRPMKPLQRVEVWVPDDGSPATELAPPSNILPASPALAIAADDTPVAPSSHEPAPPQTTPSVPPAPVEPATSPSPTSAPTSQAVESQPAATETADSQPASQPYSPAALEAMSHPGRKVIKILDPNQTARFVYKASYDNIWQKATLLTADMGFIIDRRDYRLGVLTTLARPSAQIVEPWKPEHTTAKNAMENTINSQRRSLRITIAPVPGKPDFYQVAVQVLVERETNPSEYVGGPLFIEGSGFGRDIMSLRSDYSSTLLEPAKWVTLGHDTLLEKKLLDQIFKRI